METYNLGAITKTLYDSGASVLTRSTIRDTIHTDIHPATLAVLIRRLVQTGILIKLERNKYFVNNAGTHEFLIANFLYEPSYVSFESALNFHGVLPQFPYEITSATTKKTVEKTIGGKVYRYNRIKKSLWWGYDKTDGFLLAHPEKALLDLVYLTAKGYGVIHPDDLIRERLNRPRAKQYAAAFPKTAAFLRLRRELDL